MLKPPNFLEETCFREYGKLVYNPVRKGITEWRLIVEVDEELTRYLRHQLEKRRGIILKKPSWGSHITVVNGFEPNDKTEWGMYQDDIVHFHYSNLIRQSGDTCGTRPEHYFFVDVYSTRIDKIRKGLGMPQYEKYHLTIGTY